MPVHAGDAPLYRPIRRLTVSENGGHFGAALAVAGTKLLVGAPNLDGAGRTDAHAYLFDPATGDLVHDLTVEVGADRWWQFSVGTVGTNLLVGIAPGEEADGLGGSVTVFDGETGGTMQTFCCLGALAMGVGDNVLIGSPGGAGLYDPATGNLVRTLTMPDPNRRGVQSMALIGSRTIALAATEPVGVHLFDERTGRAVGFVGTRHGDTRHFGSAMAVNGATLAVTEIPQVNLFDLGFGLVLGTIDPPPGLGGASFGAALAYAGGLLVVGAPSGGDKGAAHLFDANGNLVVSLPADGAGPGFGRAVAALGRSVAVGAPTDAGGAVVIFSPCGDGTVDAPVEQCDDGNDDDTDGCDSECRTVGARDDCGDADGSATITVSDGVQILRAAAGLPFVAHCDGADPPESPA
jgi:cysteine-rich repeat protein